MTTGTAPVIAPQLGKKWARSINLLVTEGVEGAAGILRCFVECAWGRDHVSTGWPSPAACCEGWNQCSGYR